MKAVVYEAGGVDKLIYQDVELPKLKKGWSLVKVKGFGLNRSEIFTRKGYSETVKFPRILGIECAGIVEKSDVFKKGEKVVSIMGEMGREFNGSYAEYVLLPNQQIYPIDSELPWETLAAIPETYYTSYGCMKNLKLSSNDEILVRGASSATGIAFCNLVKSNFSNVKIYGSTQNMSKKDLLIEKGFDDVILDENYVLNSEKTFDKILELIGPRSLKDSLKHLKSLGIICSAGQLGEQWFLEDFDPIMELKNNVYLTTFYSGNVDYDRLQEMFQFIDDNKVIVTPEKVFRLEEIQLAHEYLESKKGFGKIVCVV
ncbi:zinc-binding dehydrogenase [Streptococcus castoreus]|uniref:zinc-binding dehydrogenase n=1 Tax=Streptococcus castoreus TaxID=254786 RepID=UPI000416E07C|nr:zinc-binding dehydrogenase [Streptococcus castoreus]